MVACAAALCALAPLAGGSSSAPAQQPSRADRLRVIDWFLINFVVPDEECTAAGGAALARLDAVLAAVRRQYAREFALVEGAPEYAGSVLAMRHADADRFKGADGPRQALQMCDRSVSRMSTALEQHRYDAAFKDVVAVLASPI
jgi:hypothetical protein